MTYKELQKIAEDNGYEIKNDIDYVILTKYKENTIKISKLKEDIMLSTIRVCFKNDFLMLQASLKYAETPLEDRHEEKKYYLKHRYLSNCCGENFLNHALPLNRWVLSDKQHFEEYRSEFTQKEIEEIKEKYNTDLKDFEIIEVKE